MLSQIFKVSKYLLPSKFLYFRHELTLSLSKKNHFFVEIFIPDPFRIRNLNCESGSCKYFRIRIRHTGKQPTGILTFVQIVPTSVPDLDPCRSVLIWQPESRSIFFCGRKNFNFCMVQGSVRIRNFYLPGSGSEIS